MRSSIISLHVTLLYAGLLGLFLVVLSFNLVKRWVQTIGAGANADADLHRAEALLGSFTDYAPLILLLIGLMEMSGAPATALHFLGAGLVIARLMHAFGSNRSKTADALRFLGAQGTYLILTLASFGCLFLYILPLLVAAK